MLLLLQAWKGKKQLYKNPAENQPTAPVLAVFPLLLNFLSFLSSVVGICLLFLKVTLSLASFLVAPPEEGSNSDFPWVCGSPGKQCIPTSCGIWVLIREAKQSPCGCLNCTDKWEAMAALPQGLRGVKCSPGRLQGFFLLNPKQSRHMDVVPLPAVCLLSLCPKDSSSVCWCWHFSLPTCPFSLLVAFPTWAVPCFPPRVTAGVPSAVFSLCVTSL